MEIQRKKRECDVDGLQEKKVFEVDLDLTRTIRVKE